MKRYEFRGQPERVDFFIKKLADTGNVAEACRQVGISRRGAYKFRNDDENFAKRWDEAEEIAADRIEEEMWRRGVNGVSRPALFQGKKVKDEDGKDIMITEYSDTLLVTLAKARRPEKFNEKLQVTGPGGGAMLVETVVKLTRRDPDERTAQPGDGATVIDHEPASDDSGFEEVDRAGVGDAEAGLREVGPGGEDEPSGSGLGDPVYGEPLRYSDADR